MRPCVLFFSAVKEESNVNNKDVVELDNNHHLTENHMTTDMAVFSDEEDDIPLGNETC